MSACLLKISLRSSREEDPEDSELLLSCFAYQRAKKEDRLLCTRLRAGQLRSEKKAVENPNFYCRTTRDTAKALTSPLAPDVRLTHAAAGPATHLTQHSLPDPHSKPLAAAAALHIARRRICFTSTHLRLSQCLSLFPCPESPWSAVIIGCQMAADAGSY
ncbi:hypothetical protein MRB53_002455 [Persea americana]|uniref:Uncharacterized protein n=1 Tax=Persea americana TaxID=3435 RepID=A0ACC2MUJ8_PERAE|nr:hypothetical protein MRB53_002455 [Persea americana]